MNLKSLLCEIVDEKVRNARIEIMRTKFNLPSNTVWVNLYHGTSVKNVKLIEKNGFKAGTWFSIDKAISDRYALQVGGKPYTMVCRVYLGAVSPSGDYIISQEPLISTSQGYVPKDLSRQIYDLK
jgi:hypothetical protein